MPPVSSQETIPNFPLNGNELALYAVNILAKVCKQRDWSGRHAEIVHEALAKSLANDWAFKPGFTYPNVQFEITLQSHAVDSGNEGQFAFDLATVFSFPTTPAYPEARPFVRKPAGVSSPPLLGFSPDALHVVDCFVIRVAVDNPNLVRVHHGMPITITEKIQPKHGEMFGTIKNHEVRYDPKDYGNEPAFLVLDQTEEFIAKWNLPAEAVLRAVSVPDTEADPEPADEASRIADASTGGTQEANARAETNQEATAAVSTPTTQSAGVDASRVAASSTQTSAQPLSFPKPPNRSRKS